MPIIHTKGDSDVEHTQDGHRFCPSFSASTALAQRTPIDSQSLTVPLDYGPIENVSETD
jgi:hypothetical protein